MKATPEQIKKFLNSYRDLSNKADDCKELYKRLESSLVKPYKAELFPDHGSGTSSGSKDKVGDNILLLSDVEKELHDILLKSKVRRIEVEYCIDKIPHDTMKRVCKMTFIDFLGRERIANELDISRDMVSKYRARGAEWIANNMSFKRG